MIQLPGKRIELLTTNIFNLLLDDYLFGGCDFVEAVEIYITKAYGARDNNVVSKLELIKCKLIEIGTKSAFFLTVTLVI